MAGALTFFPWLRLPKEFCATIIGGFEISRYVRDECQTIYADVVRAILAPYATQKDHSIKEAVLLRKLDRAMTDELTEMEIESAFEFAESLALAGLSKRQFFSPMGYSNRDNYRLIVQRFDEPGKGVLVRNPRRDGSSSNYFTAAAYHVECPRHVSIEEVQLDEPLLHALAACRAAPSAGDFMESAVTFNMANTDNPAVAPHVELILSNGCLEKLLGLRSGNEHHLAKAFAETLRPGESISPAKCERAAKRSTKSETMRELWVRDLFQLRGHLAHGSMLAKRDPIWSIREHLLLVSYIFPLLMKLQLSSSRLYTLTEDDQIAVDTFEPLLCADDLFFKDEEERFVWHQIADRTRKAQRRKSTLEAMAKAFPKKDVSMP